jgi:hypothetical protein
MQTPVASFPLSPDIHLTPHKLTHVINTVLKERGRWKASIGDRAAKGRLSVGPALSRFRTFNVLTTA